MNTLGLTILPFKYELAAVIADVLLGCACIAFCINIPHRKKTIGFLSLENHRQLLGAFFMVLSILFLAHAVTDMYAIEVSLLAHMLMACFAWFVFFYIFYFKKKESVVKVSKDIEEEINTRYLIEDKLINKNKHLEWAERTAKICYVHWNVNKNEILFSDGAEVVLGIHQQQNLNLNKLKAIIIPEDRIKLQRFIESLSGTKGIVPFLFRIIVDAKLRYVQMNAELYRNETNNSIIRGTFQDVTEQQMFIKRIEDRNEILKQIAWTQSHEVRGPLASLLGLLSLIDEDEVKSEHNKTIIAGFREAATELDVIVKKIVRKAESADVDLS